MDTYEPIHNLLTDDEIIELNSFGININSVFSIYSQEERRSKYLHMEFNRVDSVLKKELSSPALNPN